MADTGFLLPTSGTNVAGAGVDWTSPNNITAEDDTDAQAIYIAASGDTDYIKGAAFQFTNFPDATTITGFEVRWRMKAVSSGAMPTIAAVNIGKSDGTLATEKPQTQILTTSYAYYVYGGAFDLWGLTWVKSDITNPTFQIRLKANSAGAISGTVSVDAAYVRVYYSGGTFPAPIGSQVHMRGITRMVGY